MEPQWEYYDAQIDGKPATVWVDLGLSEHAPLKRMPTLAWVWVQLEEPTEDGMPQGPEAEMVENLKEALTEYLGTRLNARLVGRNLFFGRAEYYFYAQDAKNLDTAVHAVMSGFGTYDYYYDHKKDADWSFYRDFLLPGLWELHCIRNRHMLTLLRDQGDNLQTPRPLEHWLFFATETDAKEAWALLESDGFQQDELVEEEDYEDQPWTLKVQRTEHLVPDRLDELVRQLLALAEAHNGTYDGWECEALPGEN